jgi:hypothetical protein
MGKILSFVTVHATWLAERHEERYLYRAPALEVQQPLATKNSSFLRRTVVFLAKSTARSIARHHARFSLIYAFLGLPFFGLKHSLTENSIPHHTEKKKKNRPFLSLHPINQDDTGTGSPHQDAHS